MLLIDNSFRSAANNTRVDTLFTNTLDRNLPFAVEPTTHFIDVAEGVDPQVAGDALESAFLQHGLQAIDQVGQILPLFEPFDQLRFVQRMVAVFEGARAVVFHEVHSQSDVLHAHQVDHVVHVL